MLLIYGGFAALTAILFVVFTREAPPTPPCPEGQETRALMMDGLKGMLKMRDVWILLALFLVGMGVFNGISTWIESIVRSRGFSITQAGTLGGVLLLGGIIGAAIIPVLQAGTLGGVLLLGGIIGAAIIPVLSDRLHKRKLFLAVGLLLAIPGLIGTTFATNYPLMVASLFVLGFFLMSLAPVGYQYAAEITFPSPEGTSNGLLNLAGQLSVVFIYSMEALKSPDGSFTNSMLIMVVMMAIAAGLTTRMNESTPEIDAAELTLKQANT